MQYVSEASALSEAMRFLPSLMLIGFFLLAHWVACVWWLTGESAFNTEADFGTSWTFRGLADWDTPCPPLERPM